MELNKCYEELLVALEEQIQNYRGLIIAQDDLIRTMKQQMNSIANLELKKRIAESKTEN